MSRVLTPLGATVPQYHVLFRLATADGPLSQQELTLDAGLDAAGISRLVARMANEKLVTIKIDARDRRRRLVKLTSKGRALEESLSPLIDTAVRNMVPGFSEHEATFLMQMLDRACSATMQRETERRRRSRRRGSNSNGSGSNGSGSNGSGSNGSGSNGSGSNGSGSNGSGSNSSDSSGGDNRA
ncbi:MAG: MarR family transcriptional regulator [Myxococcota bacterium]|nr:MarR family transcriptional regulator [Myxococcota bacterium]